MEICPRPFDEKEQVHYLKQYWPSHEQYVDQNEPESIDGMAFHAQISDNMYLN